MTVGYGATTPCPPPASGIYEDYIYLGNWSEITMGTVSSAGVSAAITLAATKTLFKVKVHRTGGDYSGELADNEDGGSEYTHRLDGRIVSLSSTAYSFFKGMLGVKMMAFVRTKSGEIKILGLDGGVYLKEHKEAATEGALGHTFAIVGDKQPAPPYIYFHTDNATSLSELEAELV